MNKFLSLAILVVLGFLLACSGKPAYHNSSMPDPKSFSAHFDDMDPSGDGLVDWDEFKAYFPQAEANVFEAIDLDKDKALDHDEWHAFKEANGIKDHD